MSRIEILKMILTDLNDAKQIFELLNTNSALYTSKFDINKINGMESITSTTCINDAKYSFRTSKLEELKKHIKFIEKCIDLESFIENCSCEVESESEQE
jgi:hypothetical protein